MNLFIDHAHRMKKFKKERAKNSTKKEKYNKKGLERGEKETNSNKTVLSSNQH